MNERDHPLPQMDVCPAVDCKNTEDLWLMECAPGYTWAYVNGCGHWGFIQRRRDDVPRETSTEGS